MNQKVTKLRGKFVVGFDGKEHVIYEDGEVVYAGGEILFVGHGYDGPVDEAMDCGLSLISPGFIDLEADVDTDHAIFDTMLFRTNPTEDNTWAPGPRYRTVDPYSDEDFSIRQRYSTAQLLMNGITTAMPICGEQFHGWSQSYHEFEIMARTVTDMGIRAYLGPSFKSSPDRHKPVDEAREKQSFDDVLRYIQDFDGAAGGRIRGFINPCQIAVTRPEILKQAHDLAVELKIPMRLHAAEETIEWDYLLPKVGMTSIDYFEKMEMLSPYLLIPHALVLKDSEIKKLNKYGVSVISTPIAEINYGSALNSFARYQHMGVNLTIGTDAQPVDMIQNMRLAWDLDRLYEWRTPFLRYGEDSVIRNIAPDEPTYPKTTALDFFNAATLNGAKALGREDLGRLAPGAKADIIVIDFSDLRVGPYEDPLRTLLVSCVGNNVRHTIVDGKLLMKDWKLLGVDETKLMEDAQRVFEKYLGFFGEFDAHGRPLSHFCPPSARFISKK